jgi:hypothetical protein
MVNHRALTASMIDSRDFLSAKRRAETEVMLPPGPKVAFAGGYECNDHEAIWTALDRVPVATTSSRRVLKSESDSRSGYPCFG